MRLIYQRGAFDAQSTQGVAWALAAFSRGVRVNGTMLRLSRAFFSLQSNWIPTTIALANLFVNALLDAAFYHLGVWGIPLSTSLVNIVGTLALFFVLCRRLGGPAVWEIASVGLRVLAASAFLAAVAYPVWRGLDDALGRAWPAQIVSLGAALTAGSGAHLVAPPGPRVGGPASSVACRAFRVRELKALLPLRSRSRRG